MLDWTSLQSTLHINIIIASLLEMSVSLSGEVCDSDEEPVARIVCICLSFRARGVVCPNKDTRNVRSQEDKKIQENLVENCKLQAGTGKEC